MQDNRTVLHRLAANLKKDGKPEYTILTFGIGVHQYDATVKVYDAADAVRYYGTSGAGSPFPSIRAAEEAAAADALRNAGLGAGEDAGRAAVRAQAWVGDAAQDFVLALLGARAGFTVQQFDDLSQQLFCNKALAACAPEQLASETLTATGVEAALGRRLTTDIDALLALLLPAMAESNAQLADKLQEAVAQSAASKL